MWSRKAIVESSRTRRSCRETEKPKFGNLHSLQLSRDQQQFLFFVNYGYAHVSLLCFPLVMLSASHWLLVQARFFGRTHLPPSPNSTTSTGQGDIPIYSTGCTCFNIHRINSTCGHGDISAITLLILSLSGCSCLHPLIHSTCGHDDISVITLVLSIYLSTTSGVFILAGHVNILQTFLSLWRRYSWRILSLADRA